MSGGITIYVLCGVAVGDNGELLGTVRFSE
jgi:hypothetical protein